TGQKEDAAKYSELPGDLRFKDLNNDGEINASDKTIIGNGLPKGNGSFINTFYYRNLQLLIDFQFVYGNDVAWGSVYPLRERTGIANSLSSVLDAWTPDHQNTSIPQIRPNAGAVKPQEFKSTWVYDGSFIRARRVMLAYNFPSKWTERWDIENLR